MRSLWRLPALSERARKAATERERLHMCVHNVRGGHMWREQHTFSSAVWQAQRARAEHLELHGFGLFLRYLLSLQPLPLVKGSADVASVLRARLLNVQRASFVRFRALSARTPTHRTALKRRAWEAHTTAQRALHARKHPRTGKVGMRDL